jgi:carbamoyltransferase
VLTGLRKNPKYTNGEINGDIDPYSACVMGLGQSFVTHGFTELDLCHMHHEIHAATSFYNSGFDEALCIVKDGRGSDFVLPQPKFLKDSLAAESSSIFIKKYPDKTELIDKHMLVGFNIPERKYWIEDKIYVTNSLSEGTVFEEVSQIIGFTEFDSGKTMGLSAYGKKDSSLPNVYIDNLVNEKVFGILDKKNKFKNYFSNINTFEQKANLAYKIQTEIQEKIAEEITHYIKQTNQKNICLSGGFFFNCVSNYNLLRYLPKGVNLYVEPLCGDAGNSLGAVKYAYHSLTQSKEIKKQTTVYYGPKYNYTLNDLKNEKIKTNVTKKDVAKLISNKNIVAIYQGRSESGHRALGNRSILYDPRDINGKDHVNTVKKREFFRPFAGTVLEEESRNWFDMKQLKDSKFMMYAVDVLENKKELIPAITHVDGTCRIQTLSKNDNPHFYELINEFYKITGVPILFNTSFNLAGHAIVETLDNALWTIHNSEIKYLYLHLKTK